MKVQVNRQSFMLTKNDFVASGGEGSIYLKKNTVYKIYQKQNRTIPQGKIDELSVLGLGNIIIPEHTVFSKGVPVGYTMRYIRDPEDLCKLFTKAYKTRNNVSQDYVMELVRIMQNTITHIHSNKILIVDLNELNFLMDKQHTNVYFIDVDSYQTPSFPATAIMESIRDRHCKNNQFNTGTDWFSFAIVSFQMLIGIHPYKGKHPAVRTLNERMAKNISVFDKDVKIPRICYPIESIPESYRSWYKSVFQDGLRDIPPDDKSNMLQIMPQPKKATAGKGAFEITELHKENWDIKECAFYRDSVMYLGHTNMTADSNFRKFSKNSTYDNVVFNGYTPIGIRMFGGDVKLYNADNDRDIDFYVKSDNYMIYDNRIYVKYNDLVYQVEYIGHPPFGVKAVATLVGKVMEKATTLYPGVAIQNMLGTYYASIFSEPGKCYQVKLDELTGKKVLEAKYDKGVLMVIASEKGKYSRCLYQIEGNTVIQRNTYPIDYEAINFIVLNKGLLVIIDGADKLMICSRHNFNQSESYTDHSLTNDMRLITDGDKVMCIDGNKMMQIKKK